MGRILEYRLIWPWTSSSQRARRMSKDQNVDDLTWLFVATQPSSGSTLLGNLLVTLPGAARIEPRAEGQWLIPDLVEGRNRWNPDAPHSFAELRAVWLREARSNSRDARVIIEKSPPNLCRMRRLMAAFADMPQVLVLLTRDPFAICASWTRRYPPRVVVDAWCPAPPKPINDARDYFRLLGCICGERFAMLHGLRDICDHWNACEDLVGDAVAVVQGIAKRCAGLGLPDAAHPAFREVHDRNPALRAGLAPEAGRWIAEGLAPFRVSVQAFGYSADQPDAPVGGSR
ncbi:MAG: hypothetical protein LJE68_07475 [Rhodobacter sp.]|nr:hypothetical protein [Rhodobacter sp.]